MPAELVYPLLVVVLAVAVLVDPLVPPHVRVLRKEAKHGTAGGAGLAELDFEEAKHHREEAPSS